MSPILTERRNGSGVSSAPPISSPPLSPILSPTTASGFDTAGPRVGVAKVGVASRVAVALDNELNGSYTADGVRESSPSDTAVQSKLSMY